MAIRKQEKAAPQAGEAVQTNDTAPAQSEVQGAGLPELTVKIFNDMDNQYAHHVDRKLQSKIAEKKLAQGQKLGG